MRGKEYVWGREGRREERRETGFALTVVMTNKCFSFVERQVR